MSLTRTLVLTVTGIVLVIALSAAIWGYAESNHELEELFDAELAQNTRVVQGLVRHLAQTRSLAALKEALDQTLTLPAGAMLEDDEDEILPGGVGHKYEKKIAFQVWTPEGRPVLASPRSNTEALPLELGYHWVEAYGFRWRTFTLQDPATGFWIRSLQREDIRQELSQELALGNVAPLLLGIPVMIIGLVLAIHLAFRPLRRLEQPVRNMAPERIHPLDSRLAPREVSGLVSAVNGLLARLDNALERERQFSADAAHELRTPLAALRLNLERLSEGKQGHTEELLAAVDRMAHLVEQMLLLSRVDKAPPQAPQSLDLHELLQDTVAEVAPLALARDVELALHLDGQPAQMEGYPALIQTLVRSCLSNAIQYSPKAGHVTVTLTTAKDHFNLAICDQGPGIAPENRARALSRFVRLDQRKGTGAGLGLAIAQRIAELHQGSLTLEARADGGAGLCVQVTLPACPDGNPRRG